MLALWLVAAAPAQADDDGFFSPFTHFFHDPPQIKLPRPDIHLPRIDLSPLWASDMKQARDAYQRGDYARARALFSREADNGNIAADWYLGHMYRLGRGVPVDAAISYSYFSRVAESYSPDEPDPNLLRIEVDGRIRAADYLRLGIPSAHLAANPQAAARVYLEMATTYGHPRAMYQLGVMNLEGDGVKKNPTQGLKWLNAAARKHSPEAAAYLGDLSDKGDIVPGDDVAALSWYMIATNFAARDENAQIFERLNELKFAASEDTRLEAAAKSRVWMEQNGGN